MKPREWEGVNMIFRENIDPNYCELESRKGIHNVLPALSGLCNFIGLCGEKSKIYLKNIKN